MHLLLSSPLCILQQLNLAWTYLEKSEEVDERDIHFNVCAVRTDNSAHLPTDKTSDGSRDSNASGIYIREPEDVHKTHVYNCNVVPVLKEVRLWLLLPIFKSDQAIQDAGILTDKLKVEMKIALESTQAWAKCPDALLLSYRGRKFEVEVDGTNLPDQVNYAEIQGFDVNARWRGPLFRVPITVLSPKKTDHRSVNVDFGVFDFTAGKEIRRLIAIPDGTTWVDVKITPPNDLDGKKVYFFEGRSFLPEMRTDELAKEMTLHLASGDKRSIVFPVVGGRMLEICLAQYWSSLGNSSVSVEIEFHGVQIVQGTQLVLDGAAGNLKFQVRV